MAANVLSLGESFQYQGSMDKGPYPLLEENGYFLMPDGKKMPKVSTMKPWLLSAFARSPEWFSSSWLHPRNESVLGCFLIELTEKI